MISGVVRSSGVDRISGSVRDPEEVSGYDSWTGNPAGNFGGTLGVDSGTR